MPSGTSGGRPILGRAGFIAASILLAAGPALSQTPPSGAEPQEPPPTALGDVVVDGRTLEQRAADFVEEVVRPVRRRGLARWDEPACFGVVNFDRDAARYIADRLVARADELGLPAGDVDCQPNVLIVGAVEAGALARAWVDRNPELFLPRFTGAAGPPSRLEAFVASEAPVRWWHVSLPTHFNVETSQEQPAVRLPGEGPPLLWVYSRSQHPSRIRDDLQKVLVLVDVERLDGVTADQLCDYLLMVAYTQVDPEGETADYDTILNLFDNPAVAGLTEWDRSYLTALYSSDPDRRVNAGVQGDRLAAALRRQESAAE